MDRAPDESLLSGINLTELNQFAEMIADKVMKQVSLSLYAKIDDLYLEIFFSVTGALIAAIVYLYFSQSKSNSSAQNGMLDAYKKMFAIIGESNKTMEVVKTELKSSKDREEKALKVLDEIEGVMKHCRDKSKT